MNKIILLSLTLLLSLSALAQETDINYAEPQEYEIAEITVSGTKGLNSDARDFPIRSVGG